MARTFELIDRYWGTEIDNAVTADHSELRIVCPFIQRGAAERLLRAGRPQSMLVLTRFSLADFCDGVSDLAALRLLLENGAQIKGIRNLHAKLYLFGDTRAIVTSANLTEAALTRNHEFGFVATDKAIVQRCRDYFDQLWPRAGSKLNAVQLASWESQIEKARAQGAGPSIRSGFKDQGADIGFDPPVMDVAPFAALTGQAHIKFFGEGHNRAEHTLAVFDEILRSGSHWACTYPNGKRPRQVADGDVMFMARMVRKPNDYLVYGRAIGMTHQPGRDDATKEDIANRGWKSRWPHYVRVHHAEFIAGTLANGISLNRLMAALGSDAFASTQDNAAAGVGNTNPKSSLRQQAAVKLSDQAYAWLQREFEAALSRHGRLPDTDLARLDWPASRIPALTQDARTLLNMLVGHMSASTFRPADPNTFLSYDEAIIKMGMTPVNGRGKWRQLGEAGMDELNEWARDNGLPAVTGLIIRKLKGRAKPPGNGYFWSNHRTPGDRTWWLEQIRAAAFLDWQPYLKS